MPRWVGDHPQPDKTIYVRVVGVGCLLLYGGLLVAVVVKERNNTWSAFCHRAAEEFE